MAQTFESRVILDGSQTQPPPTLYPPTFESRVVLDESQTFMDERFDIK